MLDFILGVAFVVLPQQHQLPLVLGGAVIKGIQGLRRKRRADQVAASVDASDEVTLEWSQLTCTLALKDGSKRLLLQDLHGAVRPGRLLAICGPSVCDQYLVP